MTTNYRFYPNFNGFERAVEETTTFDRIVREVYETCARDVFGTTITKGIAAFAYGSPGRIELVGGDSDADVFVIARESTPQAKKFRDLVKEKLGLFDFSKIDMPDWWILPEIETYLKTSLVEGNQVLETRYLVGDRNLNKDLKIMKRNYDTIDRRLQNIVFNRFYLNQYFQQRTINGAPNIKYCNGGSRDFLIISWHDLLDRAVKKECEDNWYRPRIETNIKRLYERELISQTELKDALEVANYIIALRSDVLMVNKKTMHKGLSFLDVDAAKRLQLIGYPEPYETIKTFNQNRQVMEHIAAVVWNSTLKIAQEIKGGIWSELFNAAQDASTPAEKRATIPLDDPLIRIAAIWGANNANQKVLFENISNKCKDSDNWATIGSLVASPHCPTDVLRHIGTGRIKQNGYGYLLRVVARNPNVDRETLESIAYDPKLESRYTEVAKAALKGGNAEANRQI